jgi:hypothetical protein
VTDRERLHRNFPPDKPTSKPPRELGTMPEIEGCDDTERISLGLILYNLSNVMEMMDGTNP